MKKQKGVFTVFDSPSMSPLSHDQHTNGNLDLHECNWRFNVSSRHWPTICRSSWRLTVQSSKDASRIDASGMSIRTTSTIVIAAASRWETTRSRFKDSTAEQEDWRSTFSTAGQEVWCSTQGFPRRDKRLDGDSSDCSATKLLYTKETWKRRERVQLKSEDCFIV